MTTLSVRQTFALVVLFVMTSLAFIQLDNRQALDPVKAAIHVIVSPITTALASTVADNGDGSALERELEETRMERDGLLRENRELKAAQREVEQLREQAGLQQENPEWQLLQSRVINPDPANLSKFITIDKGSDDGIVMGMAVVARGHSFIGQVTAVEERSSRVTLIIDNSQQVGAQLESGADGLVRGVWQDGGRLVLDYVNRDVEPKASELVVTSPNAAIRTGRVPGGLLIGRVEGNAVKNPQGDSQTIEVLPLVNFEELSVVTVILSSGGS